MKKCTFCNQMKDLDQFGHQKRNPKLLYAWCKECKFLNKKVGYVKLQPLKDKARQQRKLSPEQVESAKRRAAAGEKQKDLAKEYGVSYGTLNKVVRRGYR